MARRSSTTPFRRKFHSAVQAVTTTDCYRSTNSMTARRIWISHATTAPTLYGIGVGISASSKKRTSEVDGGMGLNWAEYGRDDGRSLFFFFYIFHMIHSIMSVVPPIVVGNDQLERQFLL